MLKHNRLAYFKKILNYFVASFLLFSLPAYATFIESTIGTAVVNDATATYFNPAALTLLKTPQIVGLGSVAYFHTEFSGQVTQPATGLTQSGSNNTGTHYYLPSIYFASPVNKHVTAGVAVIANDFNRDIEQQSVLRYVEANNQVEDIDLLPAIGLKINDFISLGAGLNFSHARFLLEPTTRLANLNIPDIQSQNNSDGNSWSYSFGFLLKPNTTTLVGFSYRGALTYRLSGSSTFNGVTSNNYHYDYWTPARSILTISHYVTKQLGFIGTVQFLQWNIFHNQKIYNIATQIGPVPGVLPSATVYYHFRNAWLFTLGATYKISQKWTVRFAGSYNQSPANPSYQIANGDSIVLGGSMSYQLLKNFIIDCSYSHAFIKNEAIHILTGKYIINGVNKGVRDAVSLKLTYNI